MSTVNGSSVEHNQDNESPKRFVFEKRGDALPPADDDDEQEDSGFAKDAGFGEAVEAAWEKQAKHKDAMKALEAKSDALIAEKRTEFLPDLIKLAKELKQIGAISMEEWKYVKDTGNGQPGVKFLNTDINRWHVFDQLFGPRGAPTRPHIDMFRVMAIDYNGREINGNYEPVTLTRALRAAGLGEQDADKVMKSFNNWIKQDERNTLIDTMREKLPEWDRTPRMETWLTNLFESRTDGIYELNADFSKYFALSLYGRVMHPGCYAPIIMAIIGAQNCGKSRFGNLISEWMTGQKGLEVAEWDLNMDKNANLRSVTGVSPIVYFPELGGLPNADIKKFRQIATTTRDRMDFKYKDTHTQPRQFVFVLDSNKYASIHRDADGNRRIFVMFAGQTDDKNGKPAWKPQPWKIDYEGFEAEFWQVMAEAAEFWNSKGEAGYKKFVDSVVPKVAAFNEEEVRKDRGTMGDDILDYVLPRVLPNVANRIRQVTFSDGLRKYKRKCLAIEANDIREAAGKRRDTNLEKINTARISQKMISMGAIVISDKTTRYVFTDINDEQTKDFMWGALVETYYGSGSGQSDDGSDVSIDGNDTDDCPSFMAEDSGDEAMGLRPVKAHEF